MNRADLARILTENPWLYAIKKCWDPRKTLIVEGNPLEEYKNWNLLTHNRFIQTYYEDKGMIGSIRLDPVTYSDKQLHTVQQVLDSYRDREVIKKIAIVKITDDQIEIVIISLTG